MSRREYYQKNKEEIKRKAREYYYANRDEQRARQQKHRARNPRLVQHQNRKAKFGIGLAEYEARYRQQGGICDICFRPIEMGARAHLDHCHTTKKLRGFLCVDCNLGLGRFKDNPKFLQSAIIYLIKHGVSP